MVKFDFTKFDPAQGKLLVSEPFMGDSFFKRSVVLLATHSKKEGTVGFILNRPLGKKSGEVVEEFQGCELPVFFGGPVQQDSLFYIHTLGESIPDSIPIKEGLWWSGNFETVKALIKGNKISENEIRLFVGYAGWSPGQLENEIKQNSWLVASASVRVIMDIETERLWEDVLKSMGKEFSILATFPENPQMN